jgi:hypothetical protein
MNRSYTTEREGQIDFFNEFNIPDTHLANYTDGVYRGTIFEFKKSISNIDATLLQAIKYLSHMRLKGESIPSNILLVSLNQRIAYLFQARDYIKDIETIYAGAASKDNAGFNAHTTPEIVDYKLLGCRDRIVEILSSLSFIPIHIDMFCVVGWANRFYHELPNASKIELFNELREPKHFKGLILPPDKGSEFSWNGDEKDFKFIMDLLNDKRHKKELGAFYTPPAYSKKATELVRKAISQIPQGNNYIILDRCAGTGNLEDFLTDKSVDDITIGELNKFLDGEFIRAYLNDKKNVISMLNASDFDSITLAELEKYKTRINIKDYLYDDELSHVIVNTYELKEWIVLNERIGDRVKLIIPPRQEVDNTQALVNGGDALSVQFINGQRSIGMSNEYQNSIEVLKNFMEEKDTNIILFENPPYRDSTSNTHLSSAGKGNNLVKEEMAAERKWGATQNDIANQFIYSAWRHYLTKENDFYVLFSPIKYWKSLGLGEYKFVDGYLFNRAHFHAGPSAISCILWQNIHDSTEQLTLQAYDIDDKGTLEQEDDEIVFIKEVEIQKVHESLKAYFDKRKFDDDKPSTIVLELSGQESSKKFSKTPIFNPNIVGHIRITSFNLDPISMSLTRLITQNGLMKTIGFYLRADNFIEKLPLFAAKIYPQKNWYERDIYFTTSDGGDRYLSDNNFLRACFIHTCLSQRNHCLSFKGSDGHLYKNQLCFDRDTISSKKISDCTLTEYEKGLLKLFEGILELSKSTRNYNPNFTYGPYQINRDLNTFTYDKKTDTKNYDYPQLNTKILGLKTEISKYYDSIIAPKLFEYELLK